MMTGDDVRLTTVQERLLGLLARDMTARDIAATTAYSKVWIYHELRTLRDTLGVRTNVGAVMEGVRMGVIEVERVDKV